MQSRLQRFEKEIWIDKARPAKSHVFHPNRNGANHTVLTLEVHLFTINHANDSNDVINLSLVFASSHEHTIKVKL